MSSVLVPYGIKRGSALLAKVGLQKRDVSGTASPTMVQVVKSDPAGRRVRRLK